MVHHPQSNDAEQSVHLTLGILRTSQAVSHALSFFWLDGFAVPAPAQVTQSVGTPLAQQGKRIKPKSYFMGDYDGFAK